MKKVLIIGSTGNQGGAVIDALKGKNLEIYGLTRNAKSKKAKTLEQKGVTLIEADLGKPESLTKLKECAQIVFFVTDFWVGKNNEIIHGRNILNAVNGTCEHFIFSSTPSSNQDNLFPFSDSKFEIEQFIKNSGIRYSIIRPGLFMELFRNLEFVPPVILGMMLKHIDNDKQLPFICVKDVGKIVSKIILESNKFVNSDFNVITSMTSLNEFKLIHKKIKGRYPFSFSIPNKLFKTFVSKELFGLWAWLNNTPLNLNIEEYHKIHPNALTFDNWLLKA